MILNVKQIKELLNNNIGTTKIRELLHTEKIGFYFANKLVAKKTDVEALLNRIKNEQI